MIRLHGELVEAPTDRFLDRLRRVADPEADAVVQAHFDRHGREGLRELNRFL